jgi:hypothetical protein
VKIFPTYVLLVASFDHFLKFIFLGFPICIECVVTTCLLDLFLGQIDEVFDPLGVLNQPFERSFREFPSCRPLSLLDHKIDLVSTQPLFLHSPDDFVIRDTHNLDAEVLGLLVLAALQSRSTHFNLYKQEYLKLFKNRWLKL